MLFDWLVTGQVVVTNPAQGVRLVGVVVSNLGKNQAATPEHPEQFDLVLTA
jgi:hypothetical protein